MIKIESALSTVGDMVTLRLSVTFEDQPVQLNLNASIGHNNRTATDPAFYVGLVFHNLTQLDKLVLNYATQSAAERQ